MTRWLIIVFLALLFVMLTYEDVGGHGIFY